MAATPWRGKMWGFIVFLVILVLHCVAILLFTSGFLLTRTELSHYSHCSDVSESPCFAPSAAKEENASEGLHNLSHTIADPGCWTKPAVARLVIIVLDALRFDFVAPSTFFTERKPWMDKLQVLHKLASQQGSFARIFKAVADPPTTSLQRLKGLTTGGLPTFIDVGNSFGAPAIVEDNLIYQLAQSGKRVVMMGDDTWLQLFPHHFNRSYPFPSFNVKDLDTVDNGCIDHLFPSLYEEDWDVLIAHFLGVDHAGHIFGVDSTPMIEKLEQYNSIIEKVVKVLESQSGPGGLHENTLLLVMGDHGQTINGDHGGGAPEEVETSIFAMSMKKPPPSVPSEFDDSSCRLDLEGRKVCTSYIEQLDFAATVSALLGIPFPYGSIGRVNPTLYALVAGTWNLDNYNAGNCKDQSKLEKWMQNYANVLCINSWQVKKYIDVYSASSVIGFSKEDLLHVEQTYAQAMKNLSFSQNGNCDTSLTTLRKQIDSYSNFLASVAELARTKWTEFNLGMMGFGLGIMLTSIFLHFLAIKKLDKLCGISFPSIGNSGTSLKMIFACIIVMIRACSFLSNSYILEEGKVASFLLASTGMLYLRYSIMKNTMFKEAITFVLLISTVRFAIELGLSKQGVDSIFKDSHIWIFIADILPILALIVLAYMLYKTTIQISYKGILKYVIGGTIFNYMLMAVHWALETNALSTPMVLKYIRGNYIPRITYAVGFAQLSILALDRLFSRKNTSDWEGIFAVKMVAMVSAWSSTLIILSGKQGPLVALASVLGGWLIMRLNRVEVDGKKGILNLYSSSVTQWSLLATCLFFCTGHWCAFDGLRYAAAFIGFDEFNLIRQAVLLTIETFGFSHILPIFGLPLLIVCQYPFIQADQRKPLFYMQLSQVYLLYGLIMAVTVTFTMLCVTIQRRHLMVWGLFAPKFVFDVVGLILSDFLICFASLFYISYSFD